jgi:hypothetical protein
VTNTYSFDRHKKTSTLLKKVLARAEPGNTKGGSIIVPLTSCLTGLD